MDFYTAAEILEEIMEDGYLEEEQITAMEIAIEVLHDKAGEEDDLR